MGLVSISVISTHKLFMSDATFLLFILPPFTFGNLLLALVFEPQVCWRSLEEWHLEDLRVTRFKYWLFCSWMMALIYWHRIGEGKEETIPYEGRLILMINKTSFDSYSIVAMINGSTLWCKPQFQLPRPSIRPPRIRKNEPSFSCLNWAIQA